MMVVALRFGYRCTVVLGFKFVVWLALMPTFGYHLYSDAKIVINVVAD